MHDSQLPNMNIFTSIEIVTYTILNFIRLNDSKKYIFWDILCWKNRKYSVLSMLFVIPRFHKLLIQELFKKLKLFSVKLRQRFSSTGAKYKNVKETIFYLTYSFDRNKYIKNLSSKNDACFQKKFLLLLFFKH